MSRNGAGTYSLPAGNPVVTGTTISSSWANTTLSDIGTALTASIANDGQTPVLANLPMGGFKHTGVAVASALTDYARADQVQNGAFQWLTSVSGADTITASASPVPSAYAAGQTWRFVSAGSNTGAVTLNISSLGARAVTKNGSTALAAGDIPSGAVVEVSDDGTRLQLINVKISPLSVPTGMVKGNGTTLSAAVAGTDYVAPGADSSITSMSAVTTLSTAAGVSVHGTNTNSTPAAGYVGEPVSSSVTSASAVSATGSTNYFDVTSISLTAGNWVVDAVLSFALNGATVTGVYGGIGTATGNNQAGLVDGDTAASPAVPTAANPAGVGICGVRKSLSGTTTIYLKAWSQYSAGTPKAYGRISARRTD